MNLTSFYRLRLLKFLFGAIVVAGSLPSSSRASSVTANFNNGFIADQVWMDSAGNPILVTGDTVQKVRRDGSIVWTVTISNDLGPDFSRHLVFDSSNNIYVDGHADNRVLAASVSVVKISVDGAIQWSMKYPVGDVGASEHMSEGPMLIARNGNLYVLGRTGQFSQNNEPATLLRIDSSNGKKLGRADLGDSFDTNALQSSALASDSASNIYYGHPGGLRSFSADLKTERWSRGAYSLPVRAIVVDRWNNVYVTGTTGSSNLWALYAARINSQNGSITWEATLNQSFRTSDYPGTFVRSLEQDDSFGGNLIALDSKNEVIVVGYGSDTISWNGGLVAKFNPSNGATEWTSQLGMTDVDGTCLALGLDDKDNIYVSGRQAAADPQNPQGASLMVLGPTGQSIEQTTFSPTEILEVISRVALNKKGGTYWSDNSITSTPGVRQAVWNYLMSGRVVSAVSTAGNGKTKVLLDSFTHNNVLLQTFSPTDQLQGATTNWDQNTYGRIDCDISAGPDNNSRILSNIDYNGTTSAAVVLVIRNDAGTQLSSNTFNVTNLRATRIATGSDNKSYILLRSTIDESVQVWRMSATGAREATASFPSIKDNAALDIAVDGTQIVYLIWQDLNGTISPWRLNTGLGVTNRTATINGAGYYVAGAGVGGDHRLRLLGVPQLNDVPIIWSLNNSGGLVNHQVQGEYAGFTACDLSVGNDNRSHIIWNDVFLDENQYTVTDANLSQTVLEQFNTPSQ